MNTYININLKTKRKECVLEYDFWDDKRETLYQDKKIISNEPSTLKYHFLSMINESLEKAKKLEINRVVLVANTPLLKRFLMDIRKKRLNKLSDTILEEAKKLVKIKKQFDFIGYRIEKEKVGRLSLKDREEKHAKLRTPPFYDYTSYTDASVQNKKGSIAGIIYNKEGRKIFEYKKIIEGQEGTVYLEAKAICENMKNAEELGIEKILFKTDCESILNLYKKTPSKRKEKPHSLLIDMIKKYLEKNQYWGMENIDRKDNKYAHTIAYKALK